MPGLRGMACGNRRWCGMLGDKGNGAGTGAVWNAGMDKGNGVREYGNRSGVECWDG